MRGAGRGAWSAHVFAIRVVVLGSEGEARVCLRLHTLRRMYSKKVCKR